MTKRIKREPTAEEQLAAELVTRAREQGVSLTRPDGLLKQLTKTVIETALNQELTEHRPLDAGSGTDDRTLTCWTALLGDRRGTEHVSCYAAPARAADLSGLPPAFIDIGSVETLRDEAVSYASRIWQASGQAELHVWSGAFHSFDEWVPQALVSRAAMRARVTWLHRLLDRRQTRDLASRSTMSPTIPTRVER